ncbi:MAG TPA: hypothetical protein VFL94_03015 [Actinomycetales bacterium]|nr:hypothetical protein [Actinomycetales bacterium]
MAGDATATDQAHRTDPVDASGVEDDDSTLGPIRSMRLAKRARYGRRLAIVALWLVVVAGAVGLLGVHARTVSTSSDGMHASLTYAGIARAGWDVPWHLVLTKDGGFSDGSITVAVSRSFFDIYETQGFHPSPDSETSDARYVYLEFAPPPGDTLVIDYDAYIQPTAQIGRRSDLKVITDGQERLSLDWHTFLFP